MPQFKTQPDQVAEWLRSVFHGAEIEVAELHDRFAFLFRIYDRDRSPFPELVVSWEALEDWTAEEITADFAKSKLAKALRQNAGKRFRYGNPRQVEIDRASPKDRSSTQ